jgi:hypothetical protein
MALGIARAVLACEEDSSSTSSSPTFDSGPSPSPSPTSSTPQTPATNDSGADTGAVVLADLTTDFSKTSNPNGAWTFGYSLGVPGGDGGALIVFTTPRDVATNVPSWIDPTHEVLGDPCVYRNESGAVFADGIQPGEVALHPGNAGEYAIARWTAPAAGTYSVRVQFKEGDTGDTNGLFLHNGVVLVTEDSTSTNTIHDRVVVLAAGDTLDVAVGHKGDFLDDSTPVVFTVRSATP